MSGRAALMLKLGMGFRSAETTLVAGSSAANAE